MDNIKEFLIEAKKQTYANEKEEKVISSRMESKDYEYKKDNMVYHDTYFGGTNFVGEEAMDNNGIPVRGPKNLSMENISILLR